MKTSSTARTGCTIDSRPSCRARAWNTNAAARAAQPKSQSGLRNRYTTSRQPEDRRGAAVLAMCWVASLTALDRAASRAKTITMSDTLPGREAEDSPAGFPALYWLYRAASLERVDHPAGMAVLPSRPEAGCP